MIQNGVVFFSQDPRSHSFYFYLNIWLRARKVTWPIEKRAPGPLREWSQGELPSTVYEIDVFIVSRTFFLLPYCFLYIFPVHASSPFLPSKLNWTLCRLAVEWYLICQIFQSSLKTLRCSKELHIYTTSFSNYIVFVKKNHNQINKNEKLG